MCNMYEIIERLCSERGIKPGKLCSDLKISRGTMGDLKAGRTKKLSAENLGKVSSYFGVTTDYLLGKSTFRNAYEIIDFWGDFGPYFEASFDFGELIKQKREDQGITVDEMAKHLNITPQDVIDCESGLLPINRGSAEKMAAFLGTDVSQLLFDNGLYPDTVPEEYHTRVAEWERLCKAAEDGSAQEPPKKPTSEGRQEIENPDIRMIARAGNKMTPEQAENLRKLAQYMFPEAFTDDE